MVSTVVRLSSIIVSYAEMFIFFQVSVQFQLADGVWCKKMIVALVISPGPS